MLHRNTEYFPKKAYLGTENNFRQMVIIFIFFDFLVMEYVDVNTLSNEAFETNNVVKEYELVVHYLGSVAK